MNSDPDPYRHGYDKNGRKYNSWHDYWNSKNAMNNRESGSSQDEGGGVCGLIVIGAIIAACYFINTPNAFDEVVDEVDEFIEGILGNKEKNKDDKETVEPKSSKKPEPLFRKRPSALNFNDNKTLILFPEHVVDQDNLINPQWRLQLG